jgi:uncharacterized membrane protein
MSLETENSPEALIDSTSDGTGRIEAFTDGVLAIAITLLILEVKVPHLETESKAGLWEALFKLWPSYGGYLTSFLVIGIIWINHHQLFKLIRGTTHSFLSLNVLFLMVVSFLPFPTALLAEYVREGKEQQTAAIVYTGSMLAMSIAYNILWRYASGNYRLLYPNVPKAVVKDISQKYNMGLGFYVVAFGLSFVSYEVSLTMTVLLALYFLLPGLPTFRRRKQEAER